MCESVNVKAIQSDAINSTNIIKRLLERTKLFELTYTQKFMYTILRRLSKTRSKDKLIKLHFQVNIILFSLSV